MEIIKVLLQDLPFSFHSFRSFELDIWSSGAIMLVFSFFVIFLDEYVVKPWRTRRWERLAEAGDEEAQELLRLAASANVVDE